MQDLTKIDWLNSLPLEMYLSFIFPKLSFADLEYFATLKKTRELVDQHYERFSVLSLPKKEDEDYLTTLYRYEPVSAERLAFIMALFTAKKNIAAFVPAINLDDYRVWGKTPTVENPAEPTEFLNPLWCLFQQGNQVLLDRIYTFALENYNSHESFGFHTDLPITDYLTEQHQLDNFVRAQWALCTYQTPEIFDEHYKNMGELSEEQKYAVHEKLLRYACDVDNQTMVNHLCLDPKYELLGELCILDSPRDVQRAIDHGLDVNKAFLLVCNKKYFNIDILILLLKNGANPLYALDHKDQVNPSSIKRLTRNMLWFYEHKTPNKNPEIPEQITALEKSFNAF